MAGHVLNPPPWALVTFYGYGDISGGWCIRSDAYYSQQPNVSQETAREAISNRILSEASSRIRWPFYLYCRQQGCWLQEVLGEQADVGSFCPIRHVTEIFPPTLLLHGDRDTDVPYEQSVRMAEVLRSKGVSCELITLPNQGHAFDKFGEGMKNPVVADAFERVIRFLKESCEEKVIPETVGLSADRLKLVHKTF